MKEILVLSLSRLGDHIQSTPLLRSLCSRHPGARITMVAERRFADILALMGGIDRTILYDNSETAWRVGMEDDPLAAYAGMERFVRQLEDTRYDLVVNITLSRLSDFLVSFVAADQVSGTIAGERGARRVVSDWAGYFLSTLNNDNRQFNRINLVDVFTGIGGGVPDGRPVELFETEPGREFAGRFLAEHGLEGERLVGLQLGASKAIRCWDTDRFAALCDRLRERWDCPVVLFGGPGERNLAEQVIAMAEHKPIDAVGKTSIGELFSLVKRCTLLVTNDTGTMHFAAAGGVPSVMLCLGPAFFRGTGPYSSGNIALKPDLPCSPCPYSLDCAVPVCKQSITVDAVEGACMMLLDQGPVPEGRFDGVGVYRSGFGADGYLEWEGLVNTRCAEEDAARHHAAMWKCYLNGWDGPAALPLSGASLELSRLLERGLELTGRISAGAGLPRPPMDELRTLGSSEAALEQELRLLGSRHAELATLVDYLTLMRDNIRGEGVAELADATRRIYRTGSRILAGL